jgi:hypothetical protein
MCRCRGNVRVGQLIIGRAVSAAHEVRLCEGFRMRAAVLVASIRQRPASENLHKIGSMSSYPRPLDVKQFFKHKIPRNTSPNGQLRLER